jgi:O-antigen/teichoic acid export membrane protein
VVKDFIKEGSIYALAGVAAKGVSLLMIPIFTYYFTTRDFGRIEILYVITILSSGVLSWQLGQGLIRYVSQHQGDEKRKIYLGSTALIFSSVTYFLGAALLTILAPFTLKALGLSEVISTKTFALCMAALFLNGVFSFFGSHLQALRKKNQFALANFFHSFLGITATYFFVVVLDKSINGIFYATIATVPISIVYQFVVLRKEYQWLFSTSILKQLLSYSMPLIPGALALIMLSITDRIMLNYLTTTSTLGIYSLALKFAFGLQVIIQGFGTAINPLTFEKHVLPETNRSISLLLSNYIKIGGLAVLTLSMFSKEIVEFFTQKPYFNAQYVLPMLFTSVWVQGVSMFALGLFITKRTLKISLITCFSVVINVALNYYLIPIFDMKGAALSTLLSALINIAFLVYYSRKSFPLHLNIKDVLIFASVLLLILIFSTSQIEDIFAFVTWTYKSALAVLICFAMWMVFKKMKAQISN